MKNIAFFVVLVLIVYAVGCGSGAPIIVSVSPKTVFIGSGQVIQFIATVMGDTSGVNWLVNGIAGGNSTVGMIDSLGNYTAPNLPQNGTATITAASKKDPSKAATAMATIIASGAVTSTANPQVAQYTITAPTGLNVLIEFGPDTGYGLTTSALTSPTGGGVVTILVAGMRANTMYHMRAVFRSGGNTLFRDSDQIFTTATYLAANLPTITATTTAGMTPQSGVELLDLLSTNGATKLNLVVTDLGGNVLWSYDPGASIPAGSIPNPIKLLPNGHFLINFSGNSVDGINSVLQEVDLTGQVVWQMNGGQLNQALASATCAGCNITVVGTHHDFVVLPNNHLIVLASEQLQESGLVGQPNPVTVTGDLIIDLDQNHHPVWLWSTFDHLDLNRHPMSFPDWTHSNSIVYSSDDKALILSMRHQGWVIKIDYNDGLGSGKILWKLGYQGDFALQNGASPIDWFYAQHDANVISSNSSGVFQMTMFDNGNQRVLDNSNTICGGLTACESRVPILQLDESAKTATIEWVNKLAPIFSFFGGNSRSLNNGDVEFDECAATPLPTDSAAIYEVTQTTPPQTIWQMQITGQYAYRAFRIPSLYPGVQW